MPRWNPTAIDLAAAWYRDHMAWPVEADDESVVLPLGRGVVAFDISADQVFAVRKQLERNDTCTPAMVVGGSGVRAVFLAEADDVVLGQWQMPDGVRYLTVPAAVRLPLHPPPAHTPRSRAWICAPDPSRRWFFSAHAVLTAINTVVRPATRVHNVNLRADARGRFSVEASQRG